MMVMCWGMIVAWLIYLEILLIATMSMYKSILKYHELAHARTAKKYGCRVFLVFKDAKRGRAYVDQIDGIDAYHLTKEQYKEHFNKSSAAKAFHDIEKYDHKAIRITLAGPLDTTKRNLLLGAGITVFLAIFGKIFISDNLQMFTGVDVLTLPYIITSYVLAELVVCYLNAWLVSRRSLKKFEEVVKNRIEVRNPEDKRKRIHLGLTDGTKLLFRKRVAELMDLMYSESGF